MGIGTTEESVILALFGPPLILAGSSLLDRPAIVPHMRYITNGHRSTCSSRIRLLPLRFTQFEVSYREYI